MSDENAKLIAENIVLKQKLDKVVKVNVELKEQNTEIKEQNKELKEQNVKLLEIIEKLEAKPKNEQSKPIVSNPTSEKMLVEKAFDSVEKTNAKMSEGKSISIPNWLIEVLAWIKRVEMANSKLSTSNWTFKQLCWPKLHGNVKPYKVGYLEFYGEMNESTGIYQAKLVGSVYNIIPIASIPPPNYIIGFESIYIHFLDARIMQFIECIHSKLNGFELTIDNLDLPFFHSEMQISQILCLFKMLAKKTTSIYKKNLMNILRFNRNAFSLIENIQSIKNVYIDYVEDIDLLIQWLIKPLPDQKPKILSRLNFYYYIANSRIYERIKEQFIGSTHSANFIISLEPDYPLFDMENEQTGEVLALYSKANQDQLADDQSKFLVRHPKGQEYLRADWEEQMQQLEELPKIIIDIQGIGEF